MLYATGDTHGDWFRLGRDYFPEQKKMTKSDYVIILGDFGIWDGSRREKMMLDWLDSLRFTTLFIDGNHENYDILDQYEDIEWKGGLVNKIRPGVLHLKRGQVYTIDGRRIFTFGGASSHDIPDGILDRDAPDFAARKRWLDAHSGMYRINHESWWARELPSQNELETGLRNLERNSWRVDYIFSHCCPTGIQAALGAAPEIYKPDVLTDYLDIIHNRCNFRLWLFGHLHQNKKVASRCFCLYEQIVRVY